MDEWEALTTSFPGWTLTEIRNLTFRERNNWLQRAMGVQRSRQRAAQDLLSRIK